MGTNPPELTVEPLPQPPVPSHRAVIGALWRRFLAFLVDAFLLGIIGSIVGALFFETLVRMGPWARLVGLLIALCYFGFLDSSTGSGQTVGKRFFRLKVVDSQGGMLSLEEAILRYMIFAIPFFANLLPVPASRTPWPVSALLGVVVIGGEAANLYLLVFNRPMRQGLHDLSVNSYVLMSESEGPVVSRPFWKAHWVVLVWLVLLLGVVPSLSLVPLLRRSPFPELMADATLIERIDGVQSAKALETSTFHVGDSAKAKFLSIDILWTGEPGNEEDIADQVARVIVQSDHNLQNYSKMVVTIRRGYDLGIASHWEARTFTSKPDEWRTLAQ